MLQEKLKKNLFKVKYDGRRYKLVFSHETEYTVEILKVSLTMFYFQ